MPASKKTRTRKVRTRATSSSRSSIGRAKTTRAEIRSLESLSPFELKDKLISLASEAQRKSAAHFLNAGRGNPNWIAAEPRDAFFTLGRFALAESRRIWNAGSLGGMPAKDGIAERFSTWSAEHSDAPALQFLASVVDYGVKTLELNADDWLHELVDGIIGDNYPSPDRILPGVERIVQKFLAKEMCDNRPPAGPSYDLFATEGGTAAMCYVFDTLMQNGLLHRGDTIALGVPTFTPYIEIAALERFSFKVVHIRAAQERGADGRHTWQYTSAEIDKLANPRVKMFFLINPSNPPSVAVRPTEISQIARIVRRRRPDLMILTDDVYGTFVPGFRSLMAELPQNTIGVYSFSKHFGCTGWRLGVIALHPKNIYDNKIKKLSAREQTRLDRRYGTLTLHPRKLKFIDRLVADSRMVALNHTAGLSLPQQVQMALFAGFALLDADDTYKKQCRSIVAMRLEKLMAGLRLELTPDPNRAGYYCELDLMVWAKQAHGAAFAEYLEAHYEPADVLFRLAEHSGIVLLDGGGFGGPPWSVRVSLANLPTDAYAEIGEKLAAAAAGYVDEWRSVAAKA